MTGLLLFFLRSIARKLLILSTSLPVTRYGVQIKTTKPNDKKVIFSKLKKKNVYELTEG